MNADVVIALARENGAKMTPELAEQVASVLTPALARLGEARARTRFDAEPAALLKVLRP